MFRRDLSCIASILFANLNFMHVKITRQWKSTITLVSSSSEAITMHTAKLVLLTGFQE